MCSRSLAPLLVVALMLGGCAADESARKDAALLTGGEPGRGPSAIGRYGCGSCHTIPNVNGANGLIGPPLTGIASRAYLAGRLTNSPDNMIRWIQHPQHVEPGNVMPEMGVTDADARDIAAFLYTLR
jgi:cytochrome c